MATFTGTAGERSPCDDPLYCTRDRRKFSSAWDRLQVLSTIFVAILFATILTFRQAQGQTTDILQSNSIFLYSNERTELPPAIVDLAAAGIHPGQVVKLTYGIGRFTYAGSCSALEASLIQAEDLVVLGVFSASAGYVSRPEEAVERVYDAIDAGPDFVTDPTYFGNQPTDIAEDFRIFPPHEFLIEVPPGATHLFLGVQDNYYGDNCGQVAVTTTRHTIGACVPAPDGLVAWYPFDENGSDVVGRQDGELHGGVSIVPRGQVGSAADLDGISGYIRLPDDAFAELTAGTIAGWVLLDTAHDVRSAKSILSVHGTVSGGQNLLELGTGTRGLEPPAKILIRPSAGTLLDVDLHGITSGRWHYVAYRSGASGNRLVLDGDPAKGAFQHKVGSHTTQAFFSDISGTQETIVGAFVENDGSLVGLWNGLIDELTIFDRALSDAELLEIHNAGLAGICKVADHDSDTIGDDLDNCPETANSDQTDNDADGLGDVCDLCAFDPDNDADGDGICGDVDNCPEVENANQADIDNDGDGDACDPDSDNDGFEDAADNCTFDFNPDQADTDGDGAGDICDADDDGDGIGDATDACMPTPAGEQVDDTGCSIAQLCPCVPEHGEWKNHGAYVSCVTHAAQTFVHLGLIATPERDAIVAQAGDSDCGQRR